MRLLLVSNEAVGVAAVSLLVTWAVFWLPLLLRVTALSSALTQVGLVVLVACFVMNLACGLFCCVAAARPQDDGGRVTVSSGVVAMLQLVLILNAAHLTMLHDAAFLRGIKWLYLSAACASFMCMYAIGGISLTCRRQLSARGIV